MNALKAREIAQINALKLHEERFKSILDDIATSAEQGSFVIGIETSNMNDDYIERLKNLGYTLDCTVGIGYPHYRISWE